MRIKYIFELIYPGTWIQLPDRAAGRRLERLLSMIESQFTSAALALSFFEEAANAPDVDDVGDTWENDRARRAELRREVERLISTHEARSTAFTCDEELNFTVEIQQAREKWNDGRIPRCYNHGIPFVHARSFIYSLDALQRLIQAATRVEGVPGEAKQYYEEFRAVVPLLREVRNSSAHIDERGQGLKSGRRPLDLQPVDTGAFSAPDGGVLFLENLNGNRFGGTIADGSYGEVEVSAQTLASAQRCIQNILDLLEWEGSKRYYPY